MINITFVINITNIHNTITTTITNSFITSVIFQLVYSHYAFLILSGFHAAIPQEAKDFWSNVATLVKSQLKRILYNILGMTNYLIA